MKRFDEIKSAAYNFIKRAAFHPVTHIALIVSLCFTGVIFARHYYLKSAVPAAKQTEGPILERIEIRNETKALVVVSKKIENEILQIELRNTGERPIISYRIDIQNASQFVTDLTIGRPLAPSRTAFVGVPLLKLVLDKQSQTYPITISMALYTDGTGEGDPVKIETQRDQMLGQAQGMINMAELVNKLKSESELVSDQFSQRIGALKMSIPANFNRNQTIGYMNTINSLQTMALVLNKLPDNKKSGGVENFKAAFQRQLSNLKMIQEVKR